jgi:hypothetical protein
MGSCCSATTSKRNSRWSREEFEVMSPGPEGKEYTDLTRTKIKLRNADSSPDSVHSSVPVGQRAGLVGCTLPTRLPFRLIYSVLVGVV